MSHISTKEKPIKISVHKVGEINKNKRVWIANEDILKSFSIDDNLKEIYEYNNNQLELIKTCMKTNRKVSSRSKKDGRTPIIDLKNSSITKLVASAEKVEVLYFKNKMIIRIAKTEQDKVRRTNKNGLKLADLFAGGGTMSYQFEKLGYKPSFAIESNKNSIKIYENNFSSEVFTYFGRIEDIHLSDYPKDIDICIAGIPCPPYSHGNKVLKDALKAIENNTASEKQIELVKLNEESEALVFHVLAAIKVMNPKTVVFEEVEGFVSSPYYKMAKIILSQMDYEISETIATGSHTNRKRLVMVANMGKKIDLTNLVPESNITVDKLLATPINKRTWKKAEDIACFHRARNDSSVKGRDKNPMDITKVSTFDCHGSRGSEPIIKHPYLDLYDKYTNEDIINIHGLQGFKLSGKKSIDRSCLGNGVSDQFYYVAKRIKEAS